MMYGDRVPVVRGRRHGKWRRVRGGFANTELELARAYARRVARSGRYEVVRVQWETPASTEAYTDIVVYPDGREEG